MIKKYILSLLVLSGAFAFTISCGSDDAVTYTEVPRVSPVVLDMNADPFPYEKLSEYKFFEGEMKNLEPSYKVIPYDLNSSLFTDYAEKKRFIWMPSGAKAAYSADGKVLEFPSGTVLIKNFYYTTLLPGNFTKIIETRLMIRKGTQWIFATYMWNDEQTEAVLSNSGGFAHLSFMAHGDVINTNYRIPSAVECTACHKFNGQNVPIGVKPQNLNKIYTYPEGDKNQLAKLVEEGYLSTTGLPSSIVSSVDWRDTSKSLDLRVRSYLDVNCAHCHSQGTSCDYTPMRLAFGESTTAANLGVCVDPFDFSPEGITEIVSKGNAAKSLMHYRLNTNVQSEMMPMVGRTVTHAEGVQLIKEWINAMEGECP